jgi:RHS repeat-associated protein
MDLPGRNVGTDYRYGMNGQEREREEFEGAYSADYWGYDSRLGRRWEQDPVVKHWESPYSCFNNNPIYFADPSGLDGEGPGGQCPGDEQSCEDGTSETYGEDNQWHTQDGQNKNNTQRAGFMDFTDFKTAVYPIFQKLTPAIYDNARLAIHGNSDWSVLHYGGFDAVTKNQNRLDAGCGAGNGCSALTGGEYQCEEFPLACTIEGGAWNAFIRCVPRKEQQIQASTVWSMISYFKLKTGDAFLVLLIPCSQEPQREPVPVVEPFPVPFPTGYKKDFPTTFIQEPQGNKIYNPEFNFINFTINSEKSTEEKKKEQEDLTGAQIALLVMAMLYGILVGGNTAQ